VEFCAVIVLYIELLIFQIDNHAKLIAIFSVVRCLWTWANNIPVWWNSKCLIPNKKLSILIYGISFCVIDIHITGVINL